MDYVVLDKSGKGWAVKKGFEKVQDEIIGFVDADNSTTAPEFDKILKKIEICDVAIGSRYTPGASVIHRVSWLRKLAGRLFHIIVRVITFLPFYDTQCGAKVFHKRVIEKILPELRVNNMAFDIEILFACLKNNFHVEEVPIYWSEGQASTFITSKRKLIKTSIGMLFSVIVMRIRYLFYTN